MKKGSQRYTTEEALQLLASGKLVEEFEDMIFKLAHDLSQKYPSESITELIAEGYYAIMLCVPNYDPQKSSLSTWIYKHAWGRMKNICLQTISTSKRLTYVENYDDIPDPKERFSILRLFDFLSEDGKALLRTALECPGVLQEKVRESAPKTAQKAIRSYMREYFGWGNDQINRTWEEVRQCLL